MQGDVNNGYNILPNGDVFGGVFYELAVTISERSADILEGRKNQCFRKKFHRLFIFQPRITEPRIKNNRPTIKRTPTISAGLKSIGSNGFIQ